jgi:membrane-associated phospholipid phosphatase
MPGWARTLVLVLLPIGLLVPLVFLGEAARHDDLFHWDTETWLFLHRHEEAAHGSALDHAANFIVETGGRLGTLLLGLAVLSVLVTLRRGRDSLFFVATGILILTATPLLKEHFERSELNYSFPSGHAARSAALVTAAIIIAWSTRLRWPTLVLGVLFVATLGVALVYEDWHLPSDVLGGWCLGVLCAEVAWLVTRGWHRLRA